MAELILSGIVIQGGKHGWQGEDKPISMLREILLNNPGIFSPDMELIPSDFVLWNVNGWVVTTKSEVDFKKFWRQDCHQNSLGDKENYFIEVIYKKWKI